MKHRLFRRDDLPAKNDLRFVYWALAGFTLLILVVIFAPHRHDRDLARQLVTLQYLQSIEKAVLRFHEDTGQYPTSLESLRSPVDQPPQWRGPYLPLPPLEPDRWGRPLIYQLSPAGVPTIMSYGADGQPGGTGVNEDLIVQINPTTAPSTSPASAVSLTNGGSTRGD